MNWKITLLCTALLVSFAACTSGNKQEKADGESHAKSLTEGDKIEQDLHNAENSLDYWGTYTGTFPAIDSPGVEVTLVLRKDKSFEMESKNLANNDTLTDSGEYKVTRNVLTLSGKTTEHYRVGENWLMKLDANKQPMEAEVAELFVLTKK
ncbi:MAG: copper resistance protein NlpE [Phocaeicola sp.]